MRTASKLSLAVLALTLVGTTVAQAQGVSNTITATALVQTPLTVTGTTTLDFGNVFPGVNKTIAPTDATAGKFTVGGQPAAQVTVAFTLPANLAGPASLAIANWTGGYDTDNTQPSQTALTPTATTTTNLEATTGALYVWLGAQVQPTVGQLAGTYTALVTMTVAYTGL
jgi:hypothetical protein